MSIALLKTMTGPPPKILYQYLSAPTALAKISVPPSTGNILAGKRIKVSDPRNLNDPFDMIPAMTRNVSPEEHRAYLEEAARRRGIYEKIPPVFVADFKAEYERKTVDPESEFKSVVVRSRILCLSKNPRGVMRSEERRVGKECA